jgi:hypothetical protein
MKKVILFALLLATAAAAASAQNQPLWGYWYHCEYTNYSGNADNPGFSKWDKTLPDAYPGGTLLIRGTETLTVPYGTGRDVYNAAWAKPQPGPYGSTIWEFTFNPYGPQCKRTIVYSGSYYIDFQQCTDGHSRFCWR